MLSVLASSSPRPAMARILCEWHMEILSSNRCDFRMGTIKNRLEPQELQLGSWSVGRARRAMLVDAATLAQLEEGYCRWQTGTRYDPELHARNPKKPVFDTRSHFCHSAPMETHAFGFRLRANAPEGQKRFPISPKAIFYQ